MRFNGIKEWARDGMVAHSAYGHAVDCDARDAETNGVAGFKDRLLKYRRPFVRLLPHDEKVDARLSPGANEYRKTCRAD
jgi:hypothetical protein